jgi:hypothetical protein
MTSPPLFKVVVLNDPQVPHPHLPNISFKASFILQNFPALWGLLTLPID